MLPKVILSIAWAEKEGMSDNDIASLLGVDVTTTIPGADDKCPRCGRHHNESEILHFISDPATATPEKVTGRAYVRCLCQTAYYYAFVHEIDTAHPVGEASVRSAAESRRPIVTSQSPLDDATADQWVMDMITTVARRQYSFYHSNILRGHGSRLLGPPASTWTFPAPPPEPPPTTPPTE